jgi:hypothetical protein
MVAAAGFSIGVATKEVIEATLNILIFPFYKFILKFLRIHNLSNNSFLLVSGELMWTIIKWGTTIILTFILLEYLMNRRIFGLKSTIKSSDEHDFHVSKTTTNKVESENREQAANWGLYYLNQP